MANDKQPTTIKGTTPAGTAVFPYISRPDTKFKAEGQYKVDLKLDINDPEVAALVERIREVEAEAKVLAEKEGKAKGKKVKGLWNDAVVEEIDKDTGELTGMVIIRFTSVASGVSKKTGKKWNRIIDVFDAKLNPLKNVPVYGGSVIKVAYSLSPGVNAKLEFGVVKRMEAVQVLELVTTGGGGSAKGYGFGQEEGSCSAEDYADRAEAQDDDSGTPAESDGDATDGEGEDDEF